MLQQILIVTLSACSAGADELPRRTNSLDMTFVEIPAGRFLRGSDQGDLDERPVRTVVLTRSYWLATTEVTQGAFFSVMQEHPGWFTPEGPGRGELGETDFRQLPVDRVSWDEAVAFCRRLGERPEEQRAGRRYRLPTEAEWEYACRAGSTTSYATGAEVLRRAACFSARRPEPVGSFPANAWGLHDMHGNVWEWCADHYVPDAYDAAELVDPVGPRIGTGRVVRGGAWNFDAAFCRAANRDFTRASRRDIANGFRVVLETE